MKIINVYIDKSVIRVDDDQDTSYKFNDYYLQKLYKDDNLPHDALRSLGKNLFDNIFPIKRRDRINNILNGLADDENLVIKICSEDEAIHNVPFELLNKDGQESGFLLKRGNISIVRNIPSLDKKIASSKELPVKILILVSLPLETYENSPLDPLKELKVINAVLDEYISKGIVDVDIEEKVNITTMRERLLNKKYDIVHFTGHGTNDGRLVIEDEKNSKKEKLITANEIKEMFQNSSIKLFYFDACDSAYSPGSPSIAYHIYQQIPSAYVIANIASVSDELATEITKHIYKTVLEEKEVANILNIGRLKLTEDWWKPVFYGEPDKKIFNIDENLIKKNTEKRIVSRLTETQTNYVYRYGIVRESSNLIEDQKYLVLHGIGGAGKSTFANYLSLFFEAKFRHILFFDLKKITGPENLLDEILRQLRRSELIDNTEFNNIKVKTSDLDSKDRIFDKWDFIKEKLKGRTLLILDNMEGRMQDNKGIIKEEWHELINEILSNANVFTIFTSRQKPYLTERSPLDNILEIGEYTPTEIGFLANRLNINDKEYLEKQYGEIVSKFGFHPLSISKAIEKKFDDLNKLMEQEEFKEVFEYYRPYFEEFTDDISKLFMLEYPFSNKFMEKIFHADFIDLIKNKLLILNIYAEDIYLPYKVLEAYFKKDFELKDAVLNYLKQEILNAYGKEEYTVYDILNIFSILILYYEKTKDKNIEEKLASVFHHIDLLTHPEFVDYNFERFINILDKFSINLELLSTTYNHIGLVYDTKGDHNTANVYFFKSLAITETEFGIKDIRTATIYDNLGGNYQNKGEYEEAIKYHQTALNIREAKLPEDHIDMARSYNNIAAVYRAKGESDKSLEYDKKSLSILEKASEVNQSDIARTYSNIALDYQAKEDYDNVFKYQNKALEIALLTKDALLIGIIYNNISSSYRNKCMYDEALECYQESLFYHRQKLGHEHPSIAIIYENIAEIYKTKKEYGKALEYYEMALKINEEKLGKDHLNTARTYNNIASYYKFKKEYDKSLEYSLKALKIYETKLGKDHPNIAIVYNNMAAIYGFKREYAVSVELYHKALKIQETKLGEYHSDTAKTYNNLAMVYFLLQEYNKAINIYNKSLEIYDKLGNETPETAAMYNNLASSYQKIKEYNLASEYYEKALKINKKILYYANFIISYAKSKKFNESTFTEYLCEFLELFEGAEITNSILKIFLDEKTFENIDIAEVKKYIKYPIYHEKFDNFMRILTQE